MQLIYVYIKRKIMKIINVLVLLLAVFSLHTMANSNINVNNLASKCIACHGVEGVSSNDSWPNLAGQKKGYLAQEITAFRDGIRKNALMTPMVNTLTNEEIQALAQYFSSLANKTEKSAKENIAGKHVRARCISCHGMQGITVTELWPNIAGQKKTYLINQLQAFKNGQRKSAIMEVIANELNDQQIKDVAEYYSQQ